jgi:hypothetical protein
MAGESLRDCFVDSFLRQGEKNAAGRHEGDRDFLSRTGSELQPNG